MPPFGAWQQQSRHSREFVKVEETVFEALRRANFSASRRKKSTAFGPGHSMMPPKLLMPMARPLLFPEYIGNPPRRIMVSSPSVLCPVDFSDNSGGALRYAALIASHLGARLTLLAVNDPVLVEASQLGAAPDHLVEDTAREVDRFCQRTLDGQLATIGDVRLEVTAGKPADEILRVAKDRKVDLIVMGSHGSTGFRKLFFGSTTERVLRDTTVPVLVTPAGDAGPRRAEDVETTVRRLLVPVDLTAATAHQVAVAKVVAEHARVPMLLLHVIEPVRSMLAAHPRLPKIDAERRDRAERHLDDLIAGVAPRVHPEALVAYGEPAEEIAKVAAGRETGLIVMGLHSSPVLGPRMGSVTYRVLCLAHRLVLAIPPQPAPAYRLRLGQMGGDHEELHSSARSVDL
jgi:nucleotide-binding universal stress UspA family protein